MTATITTTIGYDEVLAELEAIVAEYGADHVYLPPSGDTACLYVHTDPDGEQSPGCIVGIWLARRGYDLAVMAARENGVADVYVPPLLREEIDVRALYLLRRVQLHQDQRTPWGRALILAQDDVALVDWEDNPWTPGEDD